MTVFYECAYYEDEMEARGHLDIGARHSGNKEKIFDFGELDSDIRRSDPRALKNFVNTSARVPFMLNEDDIKEVLKIVGVPDLDPTAFYCLLGAAIDTDFRRMDPIDVFRYGNISTKHPVKTYCSSDLSSFEDTRLNAIYLRLMHIKYSAMERVYRVVAEKFRDPTSWPHLFEYTGDRIDDFYAQIRRLALQFSFIGKFFLTCAMVVVW
jgi:hypothetical protein